MDLDIAVEGTVGKCRSAGYVDRHRLAVTDFENTPCGKPLECFFSWEWMAVSAAGRAL